METVEEASLQHPSHPPIPPETAWQKPWALYIGYFGLGILLFFTCLVLESTLWRGTPIAEPLAFAAGLLVLPVLNFQHEILHIQGDGLDGAAEDAWLNLTSLITGMNAQQWLTHYSHHGFTGDYTGQLIQTKAAPSTGQKPELLPDGSIQRDQLVDRDMDDYIGLLRRDSWVPAMARQVSILRAAMAGLPFLMIIPGFHLMMVIISTYRALSQRLWLQALLPGLGLGLLVAMTGLRCAVITSVTYSTFFMVHIAAFHIPTTASGKGYSYWQQQVLQTRNLAHALLPVMRILTWYAGYHLSHHLWPKVPMPNLPALEPLASEFARQWELPEDQQQRSLANALRLWAEEAWNLAGQSSA